VASDQTVTAPGQASLASPGRWWVFASADFAKLWAGETISQLGNQITVLALPLVAIFTLHATAFDVGLLNATRFLPVLIIALPAGLWFDRRRRRPTLITCAFCSAVVLGVVPLAAATGVLSIGLLCAVAVAAGTIGMTFDIGALSYVPSLVAPGELAESSKLQASIAFAGIAGPSLAGFLTGLLTAPATLSVDAGSFLVSAAGLIAIRRREPPVRVTEQGYSPWRAIAEGLRAVYGSRLLRTLLSQTALLNLTAGAVYPLFVLYAVRGLGLSAFAVGMVISGMAAGAFLGALTGGRIRKAIGLGRSMTLNTVGVSLPLLGILIPGGPGPGTIAILALAHFVYGVNVVMLNVSTITLRQVITPREVLGRMNASYRMLLMGALSVGAVAGGTFATVFGLRAALTIFLVVMCTPIAWVFFAPAFRLTTMPAGPPAAGGEAGASSS
jgi:MFS family permease